MLSSRIVSMLVLGILLCTAAGTGQESAETLVLGTEVLRDKFILGLSKALEADDYPKALAFIEKLDKLGVDLPPEVDYFRGEAFFHSGRYDEADRALNQYVAKTGREGNHYQKSLELMLLVEESVEESAEAARLAQAAKARVDARILELGKEAEEYDWALLHLAAIGDEPEVIEELIVRGADINSVATGGGYRGTPLELASEFNRIGNARVLISHGANVNGEDNSGYPLWRASDHEDAEMALLLIDSGAPVDGAPFKDGPYAGETPLMRAAGWGNLNVVKLLIDRGADVNAADGDGWNVLHLAAASHRHEVAELLIDRGAWVNARDDEGLQPLCRVYWSGSSSRSSETATVLLRHGGTCAAWRDRPICSRNPC